MKIKFLLVLLCIYGNNYAQEIAIRGNIMDDQLQPLETVLLQARNTENQVLDYTYSDQNGNYELKFIKNNESIIIEASSLGFTTVRKKITIADQKMLDFLDFEMIEKMESLKEVIVEGHQKISINCDTTFIRVSQYASDTELTVDFLL
jgi:hypothetical protein